MKLRGFVNETYPARSVAIETDRSINFFLEQDPQDEKNYIALIGTPGTAVYQTVGTGPIRGQHVFNNQLFVVSGSGLYAVSAAGVVTSSLGTLNTVSGPVGMADNGLSMLGAGGNQLMITDGTAGYIYQILEQMNFVNGSIDPTGRTIVNLSGTASAFVMSVAVTSGTFAGGNAAGTLTLNSWNGVAFPVGAGTTIYETGGSGVNLLQSWSNNTPGYDIFSSSGVNILRASVGINATGGTITYSGNYRIHTFYNSDTFTVLNGGVGHVLVVAGGGGGGSHFAGGGGGGGLIDNAAYTLSPGTYNVTVGAGGAGGIWGNGNGSNGGNSIFDVLTAIGGGGGGGYNAHGIMGGSGGGAADHGHAGGGAYQPGGYAFPGAPTGDNICGGGGGGAGGAGVTGTSATGGNGGTGYSSSISGTATGYAGGGGGGGTNLGGSASSGGGAGGITDATPGTANTGGGGGGSGNTNDPGSAGGSGIVIIAYIYNAATSVSASTPSIPITNGITYQIIATLTLTYGQAPTLTGTGGVANTPLSAGVNYINFTASGSSNTITMTNTLPSEYSCTFTLCYFSIAPIAEATTQPVPFSTFSTISGGGWPGAATQVTFMDGYFIINVPGSMSFSVSNLYDGTTWSALATSPVAASPSTLFAVTTLHQQLWLIKDRDAEVWYDTGTATATGCPFSRISGAVIDYGIAAPFSLAKGDNSLFWLANERNNEQGIFVGIVEMSGYVPTIISPPSINYQINQFAVISDAIGYFRATEGHKFYVLTFPTANWTIVYDATNGQWHEWSTYAGGTYVEGTPNIPPPRHIGNCFCVFQGMHLVGDWNSGNIYQLSSSILTDNGQPIVSVRISAHEQNREDLDNIFISKFQLDCQVGQGVASIYLTTDAGVILTTDSQIPLTPDNSPDPNPIANLAWSDDGGYTYSTPIGKSMGLSGKYKTRVIWRKLGHSRDRVWMLIISDQIQKVIMGAYVD